MGAAGAGGAGADGGGVLDDPEREVDGDAFVAEEVGALAAGVGLQEVPEMTADAHLRPAGDGERELLKSEEKRVGLVQFVGSID